MAKRMNIGLVANTSWSIYNFRLEVAQSLKSLGHQIYIIAPRDKHSEKLIAEGFTFIEAPIKAYSNNPIHDLQYLAFLRKTYSNYKLDQVFHYTIKSNIYGSVAARSCGINNVAIVTGLGRLLNMESSIQKSFISKLYSWGCRYADQIWFLNDQDMDYFKRNKIAPSVPKSILPSEGVNLEKYDLSNEKDYSQQTFLFAGRLIKEKGVHLFIQAAKAVKLIYPYSQFDIVGFINNQDKDSISQRELILAQEEGIITFHGDTEDIRPYIENASCVVLPSVYGEGISRILLESAAMSTPIITSDNRGCQEVLIDGYNGFIADRGDLDSLIDQMLAFISLDHEAKKAMGENGRTLVAEKFNMAKIINKYHRVMATAQHSRVVI